MPLHPAAAKLLADSAASGRPNAHLLPVPTARANFESDLGGLTKPDIAVARDVTIDVRDAQIRGRLYRADEDGTLPLVIYYHGGGWLLGSIDSHDVTTRLLAIASGFAVLSVDYRRGPDSRFPAAVNDAVDAVRWAAAHADDLGIDPTRIAVAGDSAGGNLATVAAAVIRDEGGPRLAMQVLVYPVTTCDLDRGFDMTYEGHILYRDELQWHQDNYLSSPDQAEDPRVAPLLADLHDLPPAVVVIAECDPIRPQGELYIAALTAAGVPVSVYDAPTLVHGFFGLDELFPEAADAMTFVADELKRAMA
ncbi:MAG: alpha/beta hydrolase [Actinomycetota bacterium]|nr:alpha/beta hydrolase [Actinomycetota bacterium]